MQSTATAFHKVVDLENLIANGNNKLLKLIPGIAVKRMKKILCEKELNLMHSKHVEKTGIDYTNAMLSELQIEVKMHNEDVVRKEGRFIFVANHPLGGVDALAFLSCINALKGRVVSPSNELFNYVPNLRPLIVGVNVFGKNTKEKSDAITKAFFSDAQIMIFPAGKVSRKSKDGIRDLHWHKSFVSKAIQTQRDVVPVFISGKNSKKFYRIAFLRNLLGIKLSIETFFLPQEMLRKRNSTLHLVFGQPISYQTFDKSKTPDQWAQHVKGMVYELGEKTLFEN
jgi:putative hemolysin